MRIKPRQLEDTLGGQLHPVYIISGDEPFQKEEACQSIRQCAKRSGFSELLVYHADAQFDWALLEESASSLSLFSTRQVIELRFPAGNKLSREAETALAFYASHLSPDNILLVICDRLNKAMERSAWFKQLEIAGIWMPVWPIEGRYLSGWLSERMRAVGLKTSQEAIAVLSERVEGNLLAAAQEIEKLVLLTPDRRVTLDHIRALVSDSSHYDVFGLSEAIVSGQARHAVHIYRGLYAEGTELSKILWALVRELRILNHLSRLLSSNIRLDAAIEIVASEQHMPLFALKRRRHDYLGCVNRLGESRICELISQASELDKWLKTGKDKEVKDRLLTLILQVSGIFMTAHQI